MKISSAFHSLVWQDISGLVDKLKTRSYDRPLPPRTSLFLVPAHFLLRHQQHGILFLSLFIHPKP